MRTFRLAFAFVRKDVLVDSSYKANFLFGLAGGLVTLATFYFLGKTVGGTSPYLERFAGGYFAFALIGLAATSPLYACLMELSRRVRDAQVNGTFEAVLATPVGAGRAVLLSSVYPLLGSLVRMVALLAAGALLFGLPLQKANFGAAALLLVAALCGYLALGMLSAAFTIYLKRGDPIAFVLHMLSVLLSGVIYPVEVLPRPLQQTAALLPATHALEGLRRALLDGASTADVGAELGKLLLFLAVAAPLALVAFRWALRLAKQEGSLTHY